jgi:hypothetical protein
VSRDAPEGWEEVYSGPCLEADVLEAVLEANGLKPVSRQLEARDVLPTVGFDECRIYVPVSEAENARELVSRHCSS